MDPNVKVETSITSSVVSVMDEVLYTPTIETKHGLIRGLIKENEYDHSQYFSFLGVPYAQAPINELRFQSPKPIASWDGILDVIEEKAGCYSKHPIYNTMVGTEDCLYLNVYTPELPEKNNEFALKPVMVYIHGGSFTQGSGSSELYGPDFLITENIILVTFNYRVGMLGFLSLADIDLKVPGNAGLKDIIMVLRWVKMNISNFGGDPQNVTIFGCSAGASAGHHVIASPLGADLFHKAILQSGSLFCPWALGSGYSEQVKEVLNTRDEKEILDSLRSFSESELFELQEKLTNTQASLYQSLHGPVIEKSDSTEETFHVENPLDLIITGRYNKVPIITGYSNREGLVYALYNKTSDGSIQQLPNFEQIVPQRLGYPKGSEESLGIADKIKSFYYGEEEPSMANVDNLYLVLGDAYFLTGIAFAIQAHLRTSKQPIYLYRFASDGRLNLYKRSQNLEFYGACHADELGYLFKGILAKELTSNSKEEMTMKRMTKLWTNFAKMGNPNPNEDDDIITIKWEQVVEKKINFLEIGDELTVGVNPDINRMTFWEEIYKSNPDISKYFCFENTKR